MLTIFAATQFDGKFMLDMIALTVPGIVPVTKNVFVAALPVVMLPAVTPPLTFTPPLTSSAAVGLDEPMPTFEPA